MPKEQTSDKLSTTPLQEITALLTNCRDLMMHQRISEALLVLRATTKIAESFQIGTPELFASLSESIRSRPFYVVSSDIGRAIELISRKPKKS
jgi:hypothetical protein